MEEDIMKKLIEGIAKATDNLVVENPISKAHLFSDNVVVWWYDRISGVLLTRQGRNYRHNSLSEFPGISKFTSPVKGRLFLWDNKWYNCIYETVTHYQLSDINLKLQSEYKKTIDVTINSHGYELEKHIN